MLSLLLSCRERHRKATLAVYTEDMKRIILTTLFLALRATCAAQTSSDGTSNTFVAAIETVGNRAIQIFLTISYADTAASEDFVDVVSFRQDSSAAVQAVSNKNAPLEAFSAAVLNAIYNKYPQVQSVIVQVGYAASTVNQQTIQSTRIRPAPAKTASKK